MGKVYCVHRGSNEIDNGIERLDESKVQLLFTKFPVGSGTFKRNKFVYVQYIGPMCSIVKRGQGINEINAFTEAHLLGVPGITSTDKESLSFVSLVRQMRYVFVADFGSFSLEQIREEYKSRLIEEQYKMHQEALTLQAIRHRNHRSASMSNNTQTNGIGQRAKKEFTKTNGHELISNLGIENGEAGANGAKHNNDDDDNKEQAQNELTTFISMKGLTPEQISEDTLRVLEALRKDNGPVNWAVFAADAHALRIVGYGKKGIYELVQNLPEDEWLFGLFRISFSTGENREHRVIFFQWIGNKYRTTRSDCGVRVYPFMTNALSPYAYEIYLVGQSDLKPISIIEKSKYAFQPPVKKRVEKNTVKELLASIPTYTEDEYRTELETEMNASKDVEFVVFQQRPERKMRSASDQSLLSLEVNEEFVDLQNYDVEETLKLVQQEEGGLVWAVFEVR